MINLDNIINANWQTQYLSSSGTVEGRGFGSRVVKLLSNIPLIGTYIAALFPKADILKATRSIKEFMVTMLLGGTASNNPKLREAVTKVNSLVDHISEKRPNQKETLTTALIDIQELNDAIQDDDVNLDDLGLVEHPADAAENVGLPEITRKRRFLNRQIVLAAKKMHQKV